jgi:hypothetical protein
LDQGGPFSRSLTANLLNCKKHLPHLSPLFPQEFYIWSLFYHLIIYGVLGQTFEFWTALGMAMLATLMKGTATDTRWILIWSQNLRRQGFLSLAGMKAVNAWRYDCQHFSWSHVLVSCIWFVTCRLSNYQLTVFSSVYNFTLNSSQGLASHLRFS